MVFLSLSLLLLASEMASSNLSKRVYLPEREVPIYLFPKTTECLLC
jgi:hypothetical protein